MSKGKKQISKKVLDREQNISLTYKFLKEGKTIQWIENFFNENQQLKSITVRMYLLEARKLIATEADMDIDFTSVLHDSRYEDIWERDKNAYLEWQFVVEEAWQRANNMEIIRRYSSLMTALKQRENMYGLRDKDLVLALHSNISLTRDYKSESFEHFLGKYFDINALNIAEKVELMKLLQESYEEDNFLEKDYLSLENSDDDEEEPKKIAKFVENKQTSKKVIVEGIVKTKSKVEKVLKQKPSGSILIKNSIPEVESKSVNQVNNELKNSVMNLIKQKYKK